MAITSLTVLARSPINAPAVGLIAGSTGPRGPVGPAGPVPFGPEQPWLSGQAYSPVPPASIGTAAVKSGATSRLTICPDGS